MGLMLILFSFPPTKAHDATRVASRLTNGPSIHQARERRRRACQAFRQASFARRKPLRLSDASSLSRRHAADARIVIVVCLGLRILVAAEFPTRNAGRYPRSCAVRLNRLAQGISQDRSDRSRLVPDSRGRVSGSGILRVVRSRGPQDDARDHLNASEQLSTAACAVQSGTELSLLRSQLRRIAIEFCRDIFPGQFRGGGLCQGISQDRSDRSRLLLRFSYREWASACRPI
jgi:hypothetical protein